MREIGVTTYLGVEWFLFALCAVFVAARFAVRAWRRTWSFWISDAFLLVGLLCFLYIAIGDTITIPALSGGIEADDLDEEMYAKILYSEAVVFDTCFYFPRFSILAFYYVLFPISERGMRIFLHIGTVYIVACLLITACVDIFWCGTDISQNWANEDQQTCALSLSPIPLHINWGIGMSTEILVFALPLPLFNKLAHLPKREKAGLLGIFMLGLVTITVSVIRFVLSVESVVMLDTFTIGNAEMATQILVVTLPALRPLLGAIREKTRISYFKNRSRSSTAQVLGSHKKSSGNSMEKNSDEHTTGGDVEMGAHVRFESGGSQTASQVPPWEHQELPNKIL